MSLSQNQILILKKNQPVQLIEPVKRMKHFCMETMIHELLFPTGDETIWAFLRDAYIAGNVEKKTSLYRENSGLQFFFLRGFSGCFGICVSLGECVCTCTHTHECVS